MKREPGGNPGQTTLLCSFYNIPATLQSHWDGSPPSREGVGNGSKSEDLPFFGKTKSLASWGRSGLIYVK